VKADCFKRKNMLEKEGNSLPFAPFALVCFESNAFEIPVNSWWLDSGATVHVSNSLQDLRNVRTPSERERNILGVNGSVATVEAVGTINLVLDSRHVLELNNVVYVPSSRRNLISSSVLDRCGYYFWQGNSKIDVYYKSIVVGIASLHNGLYMLKLSTSSVDTVGKSQRERSEK